MQLTRNIKYVLFLLVSVTLASCSKEETMIDRGLELEFRVTQLEQEAGKEAPVLKIQGSIDGISFEASTVGQTCKSPKIHLSSREFSVFTLHSESGSYGIFRVEVLANGSEIATFSASCKQQSYTRELEEIYY